MTYLEEVIEGFKREVERARAEFMRPKGGQQVSPSGDFVRVPPSTIHRLEWWSQAMQDAAKRDRDTTQRDKELDDLKKAKEVIARLNKDLEDMHRKQHELITRLMVAEKKR